MSLQRKENNLRRAQARFDKVSKRSKQFQINFRREQNSRGRFRTRAYIVRGEKTHHSGRGIIHKVAHAKYRITGDAPSITRSIKSWQPKTVKGKLFKANVGAVNFAVHDVAQTVVDTALTGETIGLKSAETVQREVKNKAIQKYNHEAVDDYHRGTFFVSKTAVDAVKGTYHHLKSKKLYKVEKAKYRLKKADNKLYKAKTCKPKLKANKADLKKAKAEYRAKKKSAHGNKLRKAMNKRRLQAYKQTKRELKFERKQLKTENKFRVREYRNQKIIAKLNKPGMLVFKPAKYTAKRMRASAWQKAINEDQDNDFVHAIDSVKRRVVEPAAEKFSRPQRLQREQKRRDVTQNKKLKSDNRLKKEKNRLTKKHDNFKKKQHKKKVSFSEKIKKAIKFIKNIFEKEVLKFFASLAIPVIIILLVFGFIIMIFSSISSGGGFTLGTYAAQDYDLSEAEKYYTQLAYNLNQKILKVSDSKQWKDGLVSFGANRRDLSDTPDQWVWGRSTVYDYEPVYDFDCYKLWSFLCAYYYDFDADNDDIYYWKFDSDTKNLLEEMFNDEYEFVYWYDNQSRWEELSPYNYWGGGKADLGGTYYRADKIAYIYNSQPYKYRFKPLAITSELAKYEDSNGYLCITDNYRVLDPNNGYKETGFYIMDHRYFSGDKRPFYYVDNDTGGYYFLHGGTRYNRSFWGWDGTDAWFLVSPTDTHIWNSDLNDVCLYGYYEKYYWKTECKLYYNVKQKKTFDAVITEKLGSMSHSDERLQYYSLLIGTDGSGTMYGNHQTLHNLLPSATIRDYNLMREFGYEMTGWNTDSDGLFEGISVYCNNGDTLKSPFNGKITDVNTDENKITLRKDDVEYWYDGTGGTKRDTEVTITNAELLSGFSEGDTVNDGQEFAKTTAGNVNFHVNVDTDGFGWDYIDPRLVLY